MTDTHDFLEAQYDKAKARRDRALLLLRRQHEAMGDVMALRRLSASQDQREKAENAIAVWREVEAFLHTLDRQ